MTLWRKEISNFTKKVVSLILSGGLEIFGRLKFHNSGFCKFIDPFLLIFGFINHLNRRFGIINKN